MAKSK